LWPHGGEGRGNDNVKQITHGNEKGTRVCISSEVQPEFRAFVPAPQCHVRENWSDAEPNQPTNALQPALEILASVEKQLAIDLDRIYVVGQSMGGLGVWWSLLQTHPEKWWAAAVLAAYDNFTAPMSINRILLWACRPERSRGSGAGNDEAIEEAERQVALHGMPQRGSRCVEPGVCWARAGAVAVVAAARETGRRPSWHWRGSRESLR
jgi:pimeloyl-ACP methyl ester carboxylesterase